MSAVDALGLEVVQQLDRLLSFRVRLVADANTAQQFDLVKGRVGIVGLARFQRHETLETATGNLAIIRPLLSHLLLFLLTLDEAQPDS